MEMFAALDVSQEETSTCLVQSDGALVAEAAPERPET